MNPIRILTEQSTHSLKSTVNSINNIRNSYGN